MASVAPLPDNASLTEIAGRIQQRWAEFYAEEHRWQRIAGTLAGFLLACLVSCVTYSVALYIDEKPDVGLAVMATAFAGLMPLLVVGAAALFAREGRREPGLWGVAWVMAGLVAFLNVTEFIEDGKVWAGLGVCAAGLAVVGVPAICLRIPSCPHVDWDAVMIDYLTNVRTRSRAIGGQPITDFRDAENVAAAWLRRLGHPDAERTKDGPDGGNDVESKSAVAQVKFWKTKNVGLKDVQRINGSGKVGQARYFFAVKGYTKAAIRWAGSVENRVALFVFEPDGNLVAVNNHAKHALWKATPHLPSQSRKPISPKFELSCATFFSLGVIFLPVLGITGFLGSGRLEAIWICGAIWIAYLLGLWASVGRYVRRAFRIRREIGSWPKLRDVWKAENVVSRDAGTVSDEFVGFEPSLFIRTQRWANQVRFVTRVARRSISR